MSEYIRPNRSNNIVAGLRRRGEIFMLKGCQKKIIVMKNTGSPMFDEAYFILSENALRAHASERDMISEANRIIREGGDSTPRKPQLLRIAALLFSVALFLLAVGFLIRAF
mgnify:CR=1 FL=1